MKTILAIAIFFSLSVSCMATGVTLSDRIDELDAANDTVAEIISDATKEALKLPRTNMTTIQSNTLTSLNMLMAEMRHFQSINASVMNSLFFLNETEPSKEYTRMLSLTLLYMEEAALPQCRNFRVVTGIVEKHPHKNISDIGKRASEVVDKYIQFLEMVIANMNKVSGK